MAIDPIKRFQRWLLDARRAGASLPEACALATTDARGRPSVRYVLLKSADTEGFSFYTNTSSPKAEALAANRFAAMAFYWDPTGRQVRVEGRVTKVRGAEADAYWASRPRGSQLAALASDQSAPIASRAELVATYRRLRAEYEGCEIARPRDWSGYAIVPDMIEFWTRKEPRLHHRQQFVRKARGRWTSRILQP